jgi:hypothetical protein
MDDLLITDFVAPIIVGIILIVAGLLIEYRTGFFVKHIENIRISDRSGNSVSTNQSFFSTNWAETTKHARINLADIYGVSPNEIYVVDWHVDNFFGFRQLNLNFKLPQEKAFEMGLLEFVDFADEPHLRAVIDRKGRVKSVSSYY